MDWRVLVVCVGLVKVPFVECEVVVLIVCDLTHFGLGVSLTVWCGRSWHLRW